MWVCFLRVRGNYEGRLSPCVWGEGRRCGWRGLGCRGDGACDEDEHEEAEDGVELGEDGEDHCGAECVVACADG